MSTALTSPILRQIRRLAERDGAGRRPDQDLLAAFAHRRNDAAYQALLRRHGAMVLDVCRCVLGNEADAEDAFQAVFLVLAQKAGSIRTSGSLGSWLHGVAYRTALHAQRERARRRKHESNAPPRAAAPADDPSWRDAMRAVHEEVNRLAQRHQAPLVLCYLEGRTQDEAAALLGIPKGTLKTRLERGRALLRERLVRRGLGPAAVLVAAAWPAASASAVVPVSLIVSTIKAASHLAAGSAATAGLISANVAALTDGMVKAMFLSKLRISIVVCLLAVTLAGWATSEVAHPLQLNSSPGSALGPQNKAAGRVDGDGDPLPNGAVARIGTVRLGGPAVVAPDGKTLISMGGDQAVYHWDPATGRTLRRTILQMPPDTGEPELARRSLSLDGKTLAVTSGGGAISIIDAASGNVRQRIEIPREEHAAVYRLGLSPDGKTVAAELHGMKNRIRLWSAWTGQAGPILDHQASAEQLVFSPDGKILAAATMGSPVPLWDVETGRQLRTLPARLGVFCVTFSRDGKLLATGGGDGSGVAVKVWQADTGKEVAALRGRFCESLSFSPDAQMLAAGSQKGFAVWDLARQMTLFESSRRTTDVFFSSDGGRLYSRHGGSALTVWDVAHGEPAHETVGHEGAVSAVAFSPDGKFIAGASNGIVANAVHLWNAVAGTHVRSFKGGEGVVRKVIFQPDGKGIMSGGGGLLHLSDFQTGKEVRRFTKRQEPGLRNQLQLMTFALSADGRRLVAVGLFTSPPGGPLGLELFAWDPSTAQQLKRRPLAGMRVPAFSADTALMALPARHSIAIQETITGKEIGALGKDQWQADELMSDVLAFSADQRTLLGASLEDKGRHTTLRLWELASGSARLTIPCNTPGQLTQLVLAPDGRTAATACDGRTMQVWDLATGRETLRRQGFGVVRSLAFASDSRLLASGQDDGSILIWKLPPTGDTKGQLEKPNRKQMEQWWAELGGADARKAHTAIWGLVGAPEPTVAWLRDRFFAKPAVSADTLRQWIADLDSSDFQRRAEASRQIEILAEQAEPALRATLAADPSAEQRRRIEALLSKFNSRLRHVRSVEVLEQIGGAEARKLLDALAKRASDAQLRREAEAALDRFTRRASRDR